MVEIFKTNVESGDQASLLLARIHETFADYTANFDLEDCDRILRVKSVTGSIQPSALIRLLNKFGFDAQVLPDDNLDLLESSGILNLKS